MTAAARPIAVSMGEPAGVGGEITLKAWQRRDDDLPPFFIVADPEWLLEIRDTLGLNLDVAEISHPAETADCFQNALPILPVALSVPSRPGAPTEQNAAPVITAIERGVDLVLAGDAGALVTNPIQKETLYQAGFEHPGHTEYLAYLAQTKLNRAGPVTPVMMLACDALRTIPVTVHQSLGSAIEALTVDAIVEKGRITAAALKQDFAVATPRLAVAGLNPHAGEGGTMGREDLEIVKPAVDALHALGIDARGPLPADTLFGENARQGYDAALCMYHDQALIPVKTLAFDTAVNTTLGLPFVRTSPDHGTALDIAGTGTADPSSLMSALRLAARQVANRSRTG